MMINNNTKSSSDLNAWIDSRQSQGLYYFTREESLNVLQASKTAFKQAAARLARKNRIARIHRGFFIIVPLEYAVPGVLPPEWFIDYLMGYIGQPYYVGLLSAAALHGAAHQQPQQFQVITTGPLREIQVKTLSIHFFSKKTLTLTPLTRRKVQTGFIPVSTPEATALDLFRYTRGVGGLDRVLTVLMELAEVLDPIKLVETAEADGTLTYAQRLGWLMEKAGYPEKVRGLAEWVAGKRPLPARLEPSIPIKGAKTDKRWGIIVNTDVRGDL